jgi:cysteinyl-tRNA synthetase
MSDYFNYNIFFVMNITDIDDKVRVSRVSAVRVESNAQQHVAFRL